MTHHVWSIVAGLCLLTAVAFWWQSNIDWTFVFATLGVVAWFLEQRNRLQRTSIERVNSNSATEDDTDENQDEL